MRIYQIYTRSAQGQEYYVRTHSKQEAAIEECMEIVDGYCRKNHLDPVSFSSTVLISQNTKVWSNGDYEVILYYREIV